MTEVKFKKTKGHEDFLKTLPVLIAKINTDISEIQEAIKNAQSEYGNNYGTFALVNAFPFFYLSYLDIIVLFKSFINATDDLERQTFAKILALNLYEFLEDVPQIFGKKFKSLLIIFKNESLLNEYLGVKVFLQKIKADSIADLKEVRNNTIGHKEHDSLKQVEVLKKIDFHKIDLLCLLVTVLFAKIKSLEDSITTILNDKNKTKNK